MKSLIISSVLALAVASTGICYAKVSGDKFMTVTNSSGHPVVLKIVESKGTHKFVVKGSSETFDLSKFSFGKVESVKAMYRFGNSKHEFNCSWAGKNFKFTNVRVHVTGDRCFIKV